GSGGAAGSFRRARQRRSWIFSGMAGRCPRATTCASSRSACSAWSAGSSRPRKRTYNRLAMSAEDRSVPLYVDLDGCLLRTDTLWESFAAALRANPLAALFALCALVQGRAALKRRLATIGRPEVESMPTHERFVAWLRAQRARGRRI